MTTKRTSISVPVLDDPGVRFRVSCVETGEVLECSDLAPLLRRIAKKAANLKPRVDGVSRLDTCRIDEIVQSYRIEVTL